MDVAYPNVADQIFGRAHAIEPLALRAIIDGPIGRRVLAGERVEAGEAVAPSRRVHAAAASAQPVQPADGFSRYLLTDSGVAIISVAGILAKRFDMMAAICGWTTYDSLSASLQLAMADDRVRGILLDVDSPGGVVDGMLDIADEILAARAQLPIWAVADSLAASAAYAIAGSAEKLFLPRLAQVGSIGAVMIHLDQSAQDEAAGEKYTAIFSGARKIDGWDHGSLTSEAQASFQARVDHCRAALANLVGRQGRMTASDALNTDAAVYSDNAAVAAGLADGVCTFEDALDALSQKIAASSGNYVSGTTRSRSPTSGATFRAEAIPANFSKPKAGEICPCCGLIDGVRVYTLKTAERTMELCEAAGVDALEVAAFIKARTPLAEVRRLLAQRQTTLESLRTPARRGTSIWSGVPQEADITEEQWDKVVGEINARLSGTWPRGRA